MADRARTNAAERAHADIRAAIMSGALGPGSMLSESTLATSMSMSRTPIRAALIRLQDEGFVTIYPQRGALVRELTAAEMRESAQVRHALELAGVQLADDDARRELPNRLSANLDQQELALRRGDLATFAELALQFHRAFVELSNNTTMLSLYDRFRDRQYMAIAQSAGTLTNEPDRVLADHQTLLTDAQNGDWAAFAVHLRAHQAHGHEVP